MIVLVHIYAKWERKWKNFNTLTFGMCTCHVDVIERHIQIMDSSLGLYRYWTAGGLVGVAKIISHDVEVFSHSWLKWSAWGDWNCMYMFDLWSLLVCWILNDCICRNLQPDLSLWQLPFCLPTVLVGFTECCLLTAARWWLAFASFYYVLCQASLCGATACMMDRV